MKKILITGANSYIGSSFEKYILTNWADQYVVKTIDMKDDNWKKNDFSVFDVVFHVAGIAHNDSGKIDEAQKALYYKVNTDLTVETARKAKNEGVKQFIFMSSIIVYGSPSNKSLTKAITKDTVPIPDNAYGDSKMKAEEGILALGNDRFKVAVLRPPMIYGKGCKGNYSALSKYAGKLPLFPNFENCRSMLYIENLVEFIRLMIENDESGIFFPQNMEYVKTADMVKIIAQIHGKKVCLTRIFNPFIHVLSRRIRLLSKVFGSLYYDMSMSEYKLEYRKFDFAESIKRTETLND